MVGGAKLSVSLPVLFWALILVAGLSQVVPSDGLVATEENSVVSTSDSGDGAGLTSAGDSADVATSESCVSAPGQAGKECSAQSEGDSSQVGAEGDGSKVLLSASPFSSGPYGVEIIHISDSTDPTEGAPKQLLVLAPALNSSEAPPSVPLVFFFHGWLLWPQLYSQMLMHLTSHGFFVVSPTMGPTGITGNVTDEIIVAGQVVQWTKSNIHRFLPKAPVALPDVARVAILGHSRGGKVAFGVALNVLKIDGLDVGAKAVVVFDPVDGSSDKPTSQTPPPILQPESGSEAEPYLHLGAPALVIGTGLGSTQNRLGWLGFPPCAPKRWGHERFYSSCADPAYHVTATDYGHMDMLDWFPPGTLLCASGAHKEAMRSFCSGLAASFLNTTLKSGSGFLDLLEDTSGMPLRVEEVEWHDAPTREPVAVV